MLAEGLVPVVNAESQWALGTNGSRGLGCVHGDLFALILIKH